VGDRITYVGLDVHKDGIVVAVAAGGRRGEVRECGRIANTPAALRWLAGKLRQEGVALRFYRYLYPYEDRVIPAHRSGLANSMDPAARLMESEKRFKPFGISHRSRRTGRRPQSSSVRCSERRDAVALDMEPPNRYPKLRSISMRRHADGRKEPFLVGRDL
jgi:hypothetical protein